MDPIEDLKQQFPILRDPDFHYLDNAATSQMPEAVLDAVYRFDAEKRANVHGGVHRLARQAIEAYQNARASVGDYINARSADEVVFTYGTTSSINLVAHAFGALLKAGDEIVISTLEHHSNIVPWQMLAARTGVVIKAIPVTEEGRLDLSDLECVVTDRARLIAVTHCSNVTGAITDTPVLVAAAKAAGARLMLDGAQCIPHGPIDVQELGADFYAFSGHKICGPTGIGILWGRRDLLNEMPPFMGGGQMIDHVTLETATYVDPPTRFEPGTPPITGAVGLGAAAEWAKTLDWAAIAERGRALTARMLQGLSSIPGSRIFGPDTIDMRHGVMSFTIGAQDIWALGQSLDRRGVAIRCGHHCAQPLLAAMGVRPVARASIAPYTTEADIDAFLSATEDACRATT